MMRRGMLVPLLVVLSFGAVLAAPEAPYVRVELDKERHVRAVTQDGRKVVLSGRAACDDPQLAPDGRTVGYRVLRKLQPDRGDGNPPVEVAEELRIHRDGQSVRRIVPGGYIRAWRFQGGGRRVAVYSGGLHFAGFYVLYDLSTGRDVQFAQDPVGRRSPGWVRALTQDAEREQDTVQARR